MTKPNSIREDEQRGVPPAGRFAAVAGVLLLLAGCAGPGGHGPVRTVVRATVTNLCYASYQHVWSDVLFYSPTSAAPVNVIEPLASMVADDAAGIIRLKEQTPIHTGDIARARTGTGAQGSSIRAADQQGAAQAIAAAGASVASQKDASLRSGQQAGGQIAKQADAGTASTAQDAFTQERRADASMTNRQAQGTATTAENAGNATQREASAGAGSTAQGATARQSQQAGTSSGSEKSGAATANQQAGSSTSAQKTGTSAASQQAGAITTGEQSGTITSAQQTAQQRARAESGTAVERAAAADTRSKEQIASAAARQQTAAVDWLEARANGAATTSAARSEEVTHAARLQTAALLPVLEVEKTALEPEVFPGGQVRFLIRLRNACDLDLRNITVHDPVPPSLSFIRTSEIRGTGVASRPGEFRLSGILRPGQEVSFVTAYACPNYIYPR